MRTKNELIDAAIVICALEFGCTPDEIIHHRSTIQIASEHIRQAQRVSTIMLRENMRMGLDEIEAVMKRDHSVISHRVLHSKEIVQYLPNAKRAFDKFLKYQNN